MTDKNFTGPPKIYIAGPMRGLANWNFPAFDLAEEAWRAAGWHPISPAATSRALGYSPNKVFNTAEEVDAYLRHVMAVDLASIFQVQALALLPGWMRSVGSTAEVGLAKFLRLPLYDAVTREPIEVPDVPWSMLPWTHGQTGDWQDVWRDLSERQAQPRIVQAAPNCYYCGRVLSGGLYKEFYDGPHKHAVCEECVE